MRSIFVQDIEDTKLYTIEVYPTDYSHVVMLSIYTSYSSKSEIGTFINWRVQIWPKP